MIWFSKFYPSNLQYFFSTCFWGRGWGLKNGSCKRTGSLSGILSSIARVSVDYCRIVSLAILRQLRSWRSDGLMLNSFIYFCFVWSKMHQVLGKTWGKVSWMNCWRSFVKHVGFCQQSSEKCLELFVWFSLDCSTIIVSVCLKPHWNLTATREVRDYILLVLGDCLLN